MDCFWVSLLVQSFSNANTIGRWIECPHNNRHAQSCYADVYGLICRENDYVRLCTLQFRTILMSVTALYHILYLCLSQ